MASAANIGGANVGAIGLIGAHGLIGGGFRAHLQDARLITLGRSGREARRLDLESPPPAGVFAGIETLVHAGGIRDEDFKRDAAAAMRRAGDGTRALYRAALEAGVRRFIHVSSAHVYGSLDRVIDETAQPAPSGDYASAHLASEEALSSQLAAYGATAVAVRPNAVYGMTFDPARFDRWSLVPFSFPRAALEGEIRVNAPFIQRNFVSTAMIARQSLDLLGRIERPGLVPLNALGPDLLAMGAFAGRCARAAAALGLGEARVVAGDNPARPDFAYRSIHVQAPAESELADFLVRYLSWLAPSRAGAAGGGTTHSQRGFA